MIKLILNGLIIALRPLFGPQGCCRYQLSCTQYAHMQLKDKPLFYALTTICKRVISCNPFINLFQKKSNEKK